MIRYLQFFHYLFQSLYNSVSTIGYRTWQIWWRRQIIDSGLRDSFGGQPRRGLKIKKNHQESKLIQVHACLADSRPVLTTSSKNVVVCTLLHIGMKWKNLVQLMLKKEFCWNYLKLKLKNFCQNCTFFPRFFLDQCVLIGKINKQLFLHQ